MHAAFADIAICTPTVAQRAAVLALTLAEWRRFGVEPFVHVQPADWRMSTKSARRTGDETLRLVLAQRPEARFILYAEDDLLLSDDLPNWLHALKMLGAPATLYLSGKHHYPNPYRPADSRAAAIAEGVFEVQRFADWYGTLAVLLPRWLAVAVLGWPSPYHGWDTNLQEFLAAHGIPLYGVCPNPVQHRGAPTTHRPGAGWERSSTYRLASDRGGISPGEGVDWLASGGWHADPQILYARRSLPICHYLADAKRHEEPPG